MKTIAPLVALVAISMGLLALTPGLYANEPLDKYLGDWLFREDRNQLSTGAKSAKNRGVVFFEKYEGVCGSVRRKWELHFDDEEMEFAGKLTTRFDNEEHKTFILGEWDQANETMTWTLDKDSLDAKIRHRFTQGKIIVTTLSKGVVPDREFWRERGTFTPTAR
jgi:hypothetical protein